MAIQLGPFQIEHPFILAPMAGITNSPFRRMMRRHGSALVISELISANGLEFGGQRTLELLRFHEEERVVGLQIFGEEKERLRLAACKVETLGADFVDLNLGCPVPKVVRRGAGCGLIRDLPILYQVLKTLVKAVQIPVTIKIRTGWDAEARNALEVVRIAADAGVAWVAIHGRTRAQGYSGEADWEFIGNIKAKSPIPNLGNGDLNTPELAVNRLKKYGVDAVLIGRGALRNPFIFEQSVALWTGGNYEVPGPETLLVLIEEQRGLLEEHFPSRIAMLHARKFLAWYASGYPGSHSFRCQVFSAIETGTLWELARDFFLKNAADREASYLAQPFLMGGHG